MESQYEYYTGLCKCPGTPSSGAGTEESAYDYYGNSCICPDAEIYLGMRDLDGNEVSSFPVIAYNVNVVLIGGAANKSQYITVWNSDPDNQVIGTLKNGRGPFGFMLILNPGQTPPGYVIGDPDGEGASGIYVTQYGVQYV